MATGIDWNTYPILKTYALLGGAGTSSGTTTILNGDYGFSGVFTGDFNGTEDIGNVPTALKQLGNLINNIDGIAPDYNSLPTPSNNTITFTPGKYNLNVPQSISNVNLVFDAGGNPNAQFIIQITSDILFSNVPSIQLINQASNCNIFWSSNSISFSWGYNNTTRYSRYFHRFKHIIFFTG
jgi:hypothetical protein